MKDSYLIVWRSGDWVLLDAESKHSISSGKDAIKDRPFQIAAREEFTILDIHYCLPSFEYSRYRDYLEHEYGTPRLANEREG